MVGKCDIALHLVTSPSRSLLLKGVLKYLTLRSIVRLSLDGRSEVGKEL